MNAGNLVVEIVQAWAQEWENVESPIDPASYLLPMLQLIVSF